MSRGVRTTLAIIACLAALAVVVTRFVPASRVYCVAAVYVAAPEDDAALAQWLKNQPGVVPHTVHVDRPPANPRKLIVSFIQVRTLNGQPPFPELEAAAKARGYELSSPGFQDERP